MAYSEPEKALRTIIQAETACLKKRWPKKGLNAPNRSPNHTGDNIPAWRVEHIGRVFLVSEKPCSALERLKLEDSTPQILNVALLTPSAIHDFQFPSSYTKRFVFWTTSGCGTVCVR